MYMYHITAKSLINNPQYMYCTCTCTLQMATINNSTLHIQDTRYKKVYYSDIVYNRNMYSIEL